MSRPCTLEGEHRVVITAYEDSPSGLWVVECRDPEVASQGPTLQDALVNFAEALTLLWQEP